MNFVWTWVYKSMWISGLESGIVQFVLYVDYITFILETLFFNLKTVYNN